METGSAKGEGFLSRMALNDNKAGMEGLDRDKINKIIMESSKGSRFYENELKREQQVNQRIEKMMLQKAQITEQQLKKAQAQVERAASELERSRDLNRVIVHVDMDAFYAAVEMRDCPELKDKPMAVGSMSMLSTSNYHARKYGVRAAMPGFIAKKLCPNLVIVPTNFDKYRAVSDEIREIFADYDPHFQPLSLDEAYLDFTEHLEQRKSWPESSRTHRFRTSSTGTGEGQSELPQQTVAEVEDLSPVLFEDSPGSSPCSLGSGGAGVAGGAFEVFGASVEEAVREMRFRIEQKTTLTASAGIAPNMMLAKVCSDKNKPNGQYRLPSNREAVMDFIQNLPVRKVFGIGKVSEKMLSALGISSCAHLGQQMALLTLLFSETAWHHFMRISLGLGSTHIQRGEERKSMSTERTFREMSTAEEQLSLCRELCQDLAEDVKKEGLKGKTVTLKLKNVNFEVKTRAWTLPCAVATVDEIFAVAKDLLKTEIENVSPQPLRLRLMGVRISAFVSSDDKKPLQRSIVGFLQQGKTDSGQKPGRELLFSSSIQTPPLACVPAAQKGQRQGEVPWLANQRGAEVNRVSEQQQQSFFQRAHAQRLRLQAENTSEEGHGGDSSVITSTGTHAQKSEDSPTKLHESKSNFTASGRRSARPNTENVSVFPLEAQASTSGWGGTHSESLTCPVCFRQVETTDLNVFNRHIDQCLSDVSTKPDQSIDIDSESDVELEKGHKGWEVMDNEREEFEFKEQREKAEQSKDSHVVKMSKPIHKLTYSNARINQDTSEQGPFEPNRKDPQPDRDSLKNDDIDSFQRVSSVHSGCPGTVTSQQPQSHYDRKGPVLICPVCQVTQDTDDLRVFNCHVDLCLNQEVLHELRGQTSPPMHPPSITVTKSKVIERDLPLPRQLNKGKSKRRDSPSSPPSKKAKALGPRNTIDKFFR
uniref:DNA polymerase kappa n=1 Tax=Centroberyx gerrardi TaxID=166262 RepID=UPI003AB04D9E